MIGYPALADCAGDIAAAIDLLATTFTDGNKLLVCGNGRSAADSEHIVAELIRGFLKPRPIPAATAEELSTSGPGGADLARKLEGGCRQSP